MHPGETKTTRMMVPTTTKATSKRTTTLRIITTTTITARVIKATITSKTNHENNYSQIWF